MREKLAYLSHGILNGCPSQQQSISTLELKQNFPTDTEMPRGLIINLKGMIKSGNKEN